MDTRTATAELGWISFPANGVRTICFANLCAWVCVCVGVCAFVCVVPQGKQFDYTLQCSINESVKIVITVAR